MKNSTILRPLLFLFAISTLLFFMGGSCGGGTTPTAYSYNALLGPMGGTYTSNVIDISYYVEMQTSSPTPIEIPPGFGDVYTLVEYSTNGGVNYNLCHNTQGNPGDYLTFTEAPSIQHLIFHWDADGDLGAGASVENCLIRVRVFHAGDDPCTKPPVDVEITEEFNVELSGVSICGDPPTITTESIPDATDEEPYTFTFAASNGYGDLSWSLASDIDEAIVMGLTFSESGILSGTPVVQGEHKGSNVQITLDVWVTDSCPEGARTDNHVYTLTILPQEPVCAAPPEFNPEQTMSDATEGEPYNYALIVSGGEGELTFDIVLGALPSGLSLNQTEGVVSGTPDDGTAGTYPLTFRVTDSCPTPQSDEISLELIVQGVGCAPPPEFDTGQSMSNATEGTPYSYTLIVTGGEGDLTFDIIMGALPSSLALAQDTGIVSGTPDVGTAGTYPITFRVTDSCETPQSDEIALQLIVEEMPIECDPAPEITTTSLPNGTVDDPYSQTLTATGGHGALTWSTLSTLPPGLSFGTDGVLSGTPTTAGEWTDLMFMVEDSCPLGAQSDTAMLSLIIEAPACADPPDITTTTVDTGYEGMGYEFQLQAINGEGNLTWELVSGELPYDVSLYPDGRLDGVIECGYSGLYDFTVRVTDSCEIPGPQSDEQALQMTVEMFDCNPLDIDDYQVIPEAEVMIDYYYEIQLASEGEGNRGWSLISGPASLPDGMTFIAGILSGRPDIGTYTNYPLEVRVMDACPCDPQEDTFQFTLIVNQSTNHCYQEPVAYHTFCLECPEILPQDPGDGVVNVHFIHDGIQTSPTDIEMEIFFDDGMVNIDPLEIIPGPVVPVPDNFHAMVSTGVITITYTQDLPPPEPIDDTGLFAIIRVVNDNQGANDDMDMSFNVILFMDEVGTNLDYNTWGCTFTVEGAD